MIEMSRDGILELLRLYTHTHTHILVYLVGVFNLVNPRGVNSMRLVDLLFKNEYCIIILYNVEKWHPLGETFKWREKSSFIFSYKLSWSLMPELRPG